MDVLHRQVEDYESEIRFLKDAKSPGPRVRSRTPRRAYTGSGGMERSGSTDSLQGLGDGSLSAFEAALFRPALQAARRDAAQWKARATITTLLDLPPLHAAIPALGQNNGEEEKTADEDTNPFLQLSSALSFYRKETASIKIVDISKPKDGISPRLGLHRMMMKKASAANKLDKAAAAARQWLEMQGSVDQRMKLDFGENPLVGRVKLAGSEPIHTISTSATQEDLYRLQLHLVQ